MTKPHPDGGAILGPRRKLSDFNCIRCVGCDHIKHVDEFPKKGPRGYQRQTCRLCIASAMRAYRLKKPEIFAAINERRLRGNLGFEAVEKLRAMDKSDKRRERNRIYVARKRSTVAGTLKNRIASSMAHRLKGGKGRWKTGQILGYSIEDLKAHFERQFVRGMGWHNMGEWHIDHIVPLSSFKISGPGDPELRRAWALPNLRPIWAEENLKKNARRTHLL